MKTFLLFILLFSFLLLSAGWGSNQWSMDKWGTVQGSWGTKTTSIGDGTIIHTDSVDVTFTDSVDVTIEDRS